MVQSVPPRLNPVREQERLSGDVVLRPVDGCPPGARRDRVGRVHNGVDNDGSEHAHLHMQRRVDMAVVEVRAGGTAVDVTRHTDLREPLVGVLARHLEGGMSHPVVTGVRLDAVPVDRVRPLARLQRRVHDLALGDPDQRRGKRPPRGRALETPDQVLGPVREPHPAVEELEVEGTVRCLPELGDRRPLVRLTRRHGDLGRELFVLHVTGAG